jgi:biopolymer transport protein ExbD
MKRRVIRKGPPKPHGESIPNLAPLVDVIMVLLIFFMLGASLNLKTEGVLQTELDDRSGPDKGETVEINPSIRIGLEDLDDGASCNIYVMDTVLGEEFDELLEFMITRRLAGADVTNSVVIGAQGTVRYKYIIAAFDSCVRAGFKNVQFAVSFAADDGG